MSISFWNDGRSMMNWFWCSMNWDIGDSFNYKWLHSFVLDWNVMFTVDSYYWFNRFYLFFWSCFFWSCFFCLFEDGLMSFRYNIQRNISNLSNFKSLNMSGCFWSDRRSMMYWFWCSVNWDIGDSFNYKWLHFFVLDRNVVLSIDSDYWISWLNLFFCNNFFCLFKNSLMSFRNNMQRNIGDLSNLESINMPSSFWYNSRSMMSRFWCYMNWNICDSFNNKWLNSFVLDWDVVFSIDSYYCLFRSNFFCWSLMDWVDSIRWNFFLYWFKFKCFSIDNWYYFYWNVKVSSNFECVNISIMFWDDSIISIYVIWSFSHSKVFDAFNFNGFSFIFKNWNEIIIIYSDNSIYRAYWMTLLDWNFFNSWFCSWFFYIRTRGSYWLWFRSDNFSVSISSISWLYWD